MMFFKKGGRLPKNYLFSYGVDQLEIVQLLIMDGCDPKESIYILQTVVSRKNVLKTISFMMVGSNSPSKSDIKLFFHGKTRISTFFIQTRL